jgi:hypothetical protein
MQRIRIFIRNGGEVVPTALQRFYLWEQDKITIIVAVLYYCSGWKDKSPTLTFRYFDAKEHTYKPYIED